MALGDAIPYFMPGDTRTGFPTAAIRAKRFVTVVGGAVPAADTITGMVPIAEVTTAGQKPFGVAAQTVPIGTVNGVGSRGVTVYTSPAIVVPVTAATALTGGTVVMSDATGAATAYVQNATGPGNFPAGIVEYDVAAGADAQVKLI